MMTSTGPDINTPLVIESAITPFRRGEPVNDVGSTASIAIECLDAGASIIHHHHDYRLDSQDSVTEMVSLGTQVLSARPGALLYPDFVRGNTYEEKASHFRPLIKAGTIGFLPIDPGSITFGGLDENYLPVSANRFGQTYDEAQTAVSLGTESGVPVTIGVYEPGYLKFALAYAAVGKLPAGSMVKLYFAGQYSIYDLGKKALNFGLPPVRESLDAYLKMLEGTSIPWSVGVMGGVALETEIARYALEKGGHIRVGTEDAAGLSDATDVEMVREVVALAEQVGRPVARYDEALGLLLGKLTTV